MSAAAQQDALRRASSNMSSASDDSVASDESMRNNASIRVRKALKTLEPCPIYYA